MYLAPLNYDRFFKKVFRDLEIAKKFLEDFLDITIEEITKLETSHRVTDDSVLVEFDFRCKIEGNYVIIDMQQWYKPDVSHRFYLYHSLSTSLQLEDLPLKSIKVDKKTGKEKKIKDYRYLEPVITIVWMVDDVLGNDEDILAYRMFPEDLSWLLNESELWDRSNVKQLLKEREKVIKKMKNRTKGLDFIPKNRLIFAFQNNIVKNKKIKKYIRWFELAAKTKEKENKADDFLEFEKDKDFKAIFRKIKKRLIRKNLQAEELEYITEERTRQEEIQRTIDGYVSDKASELDMALEALEEKEAVIEETAKALVEKEAAIEQTTKALVEKEATIEETTKALEEKEAVIEENTKALEEKEAVIEENTKALEEKEAVIEANKQQLQESAKIMKEAGIAIEQIETTTKLTKEEILKL